MIKQRLFDRYGLYLLLFSLSCLYTGCQSKVQEDGKKVVFRYNEHKNIGSLDPAFAKDLADIQAVNQLFNGLVELDDSLQIQPCIAKNWVISEDGKTYLFTLKVYYLTKLISTRLLLALPLAVLLVSIGLDSP